MFIHPFAYVMVATFVGALVVLMLGIAGLGNPQKAATTTGARATKLMALRVGLCALLLVEILIYVAFIKP